MECKECMNFREIIGRKDLKIKELNEELRKLIEASYEFLSYINADIARGFNQKLQKIVDKI